MQNSAPPIVNPIAMFLSAVMMLEHIGEVEKPAGFAMLSLRP
jgi:isocitrate/isopropylmalate dehydrogenase